MTTELRFVFDTNAIISALLLKNSVSRRALDEGRKRGKLLISVDTLNEINDVVRRDKFNRYVSEEERIQFLSALVKESILIEIDDRVEVCRDPKDDKFLELAVNGDADMIVSGDKDLLVLNPFREVLILRPDEFLESFD